MRRAGWGRWAGSLASALLVCALGHDLLASAPASGEPPADPNAERIQITATRVPEDAATIPGSLTIITGEEMRRRGVWDLRGALSLAAGIDIAPGGDGGPLAYVPEMWGLREFDAFLLVIDGVPWGGAFVPALTTIDLHDVERIEVLRGPAPVMYGATSFVGVIHVIHHPPGGQGKARASGGSFGTGALSASMPLTFTGRMKSTLSGTAGQLGFQEDRTEGRTGHLAWRGDMPVGAAGGLLRLRAEGFWIGQEPGSPHPRVGEVLTPDVQIGSNHNPDDAFLRERRLQLSAGLERPMPLGLWSATVSVSRSSQDNLRGFLTDVTTTAPNAVGFHQEIGVTDLYIDAHAAFTRNARWKGVVGVDHLGGRALATGGDFDYFVNLDGEDPPDPDSLPSQSDVRIRNRRDFSGLYGQVEWLPSERWRIQAGARLNRAQESRRVRSVEFGVTPPVEDADHDTVLRGSGSAGVTWTAWSRQDSAIHLYGSFSQTFKPAVSDFGLDSEAELLAPETATIYQAGAKHRLAGGRLEVDLGLFQLNFANVVLSQANGGLPQLVNAGKERFEGAELEVDWRVRPDLSWRTSYSLHDARFVDFLTEFGGVPTQLRGNRFEMSARNMAATGVLWSPAGGWTATAQAQYVGSRYLNKRNTALASDYTTWSAGVGYRTQRWELRLDGTNLNDRRPPVAESELGDAQYYRLPARRVLLSTVWSFR